MSSPHVGIDVGIFIGMSVGRRDESQRETLASPGLVMPEQAILGWQDELRASKDAGVPGRAIPGNFGLD